MFFCEVRASDSRMLSARDRSAYILFALLSLYLCGCSYLLLIGEAVLACFSREIM